MARRSKQQGRQGPPPRRLILDAGAVIAAAQRHPRVRAMLAVACELGAEVIVPSVVVAETVRGTGPRDAPVNLVLNAIGNVGELDETLARAAGGLLGDAAMERGHVADACVVAECIARGGGVILTGDPEDLGRLAEGHSKVVIQALAAA